MQTGLGDLHWICLIAGSALCRLGHLEKTSDPFELQRD